PVAIALATALVAGGAFARELPVGDGHVSDHPAAGSVFACQRQFTGGGARAVGPWFHGTTWDPATKPHVTGSVLWPNATYALTVKGNELAYAGNGLPVRQPTGVFPVGRADPAFQYDGNPNTIAAHALAFAIPAVPTKAAIPACLPMGMIAFTTT